MMKSMTGFGRAEAVTDSQRICIELKSVNHRYLDLSFRMPRKLAFLEGRFRSLAKEYIQRGKVDIYVTLEDYSALNGGLKYNEALAGQYLTYLAGMSERFGIENDITTSTLARLPDIFTVEEPSIDEDTYWALIEDVARTACRRFVEARAREGEQLKMDLQEKLSYLQKKVIQVQERSPMVVDAYREKLTAKVKELMADSSIEESRIAAEVVIYSDKICNDEETVRLLSHIQGMEKMLTEQEGIGRKLDFMAQEMNREANTILSKSNDIEVSNLAIDIKTEIEKIREQIQNIE
ncbi:MAG: YicC family protein [Blautia sp.]|nr:YicC family protein [Blautia sp.]